MEDKTYTLMRTLEQFVKRDINGSEANAKIKVLCPNQGDLVPQTVNRLQTGRYSITDAYEALEPYIA